MPLQKKTFASREDLVYEAVKDSVLSGELKPNELISQAEIARQLGVSVIPVRNAISRLVAEGLLVQDPYHSPQVQALTRAELEEVLLICSHLEVLATRLSTPHIGQKELAGLCARLEEMNRSIEQNDLLRYGVLNREFHKQIYSAGPYPRLRQMIADLWDKADIYRFRAMFDLLPELAPHTHAEHIQLVELLEAQDVEAAAELMERHKAYSRRAFLTAYEHPAAP